MCEFCVRHGDGKTWYLNASNYAAELLHDVRRAQYIEDFLPDISANGKRWLKILDRGVRRAPTVARRIGRIQSRRMKKVHYGQVIPIEDVASILDIVGQVTRLPCVCRQTLLGKEEATCYLLSASPDRLGLKDLIGTREESRPFVDGMETVPRNEALREMEQLERRGMIHTVWTFMTPFIGAICNCDPDGCLAINFAGRGLSLYLPGEGKIVVDHAACSACSRCVEVCRFDALTLEGSVLAVDTARCHGCGICRPICPEKALRLRPLEPVTA